MPPPRYLAIANPTGKRWQDYARDLSAFWSDHGVVPEVEVVPWAEVVPRDGCLDGLAAFDRPAIVRLESPGRDWDVARQLLLAGCRAEPDADPTDWARLPYQKGRLVRPGLLYRGLRHVLHGLRASFDRRPHLQPLACPLDVAVLFDKNATAARLEAVGVPCPPSLPAHGDARALLADLADARFDPAYVKLNTGSSASAIAVVDTARRRALSTVIRLPDGYYSTRRPVRYAGEELEALLDFLLVEGVCVQQGVRKARLEGDHFDLRVVVIHGRPEFVVFRLSPWPLTNLHLGGRRGDFAACRSAIPTRAWLDALDAAVATARSFRSATVGVDVALEAGYLRHYVLEANAFGDFFPGLVDDRGRSVHRVEIEATAARVGLLAAG